MFQRIFHRLSLALLALYYVPGAAQGIEPERASGVVFKKIWDSPMQSGKQTLEDLTNLLGRTRDPDNIDFNPVPDLEIYAGVTYLMPFSEACKKLGLQGQITSRVQVACPGFPRESCYFVPFRGRFGGFNFLYLVVDCKDQVIAVQLVDESPSSPRLRSSNWQPWRTYNFINYRVNASSTNAISHEPRTTGKVTLIRSELYSRRQNKCLESVELYLPEPLVRFIKSAIARAQPPKTTKSGLR